MSRYIHPQCNLMLVIGSFFGPPLKTPCFRQRQIKNRVMDIQQISAWVTGFQHGALICQMLIRHLQTHSANLQM